MTMNDKEAEIKIQRLFKSSMVNPPNSIKHNIENVLRPEKDYAFRPVFAFATALTALVMVFALNLFLKYDHDKKIYEYFNETYTFDSTAAEDESYITTEYMDTIGINI